MHAGAENDLHPDADVVWCDEAGFTGDNLLDPEQPWFAVAGVCLSSRRANELIAYAHRRIGKGSSEVKAGRLLKHHKGRKVVFDLAREIETDAVVMLAQKNVSLAYKFFEYAVEPILQERSSIFYRLDFHRFCGMLLHMELRCGHSRSVELLRDLRTIVRSGSVSSASMLFGSTDLSSLSPWIRMLVQLVRSSPAVVEAELAGLRGNGEEKWILDLTLTAAGRVLSEWGNRKSSFVLVVDDSKPLRAQADVLDMFGAMDGKTITTEMGNRKHNVGWHQAGKARFGDSKSHAGLQLADLAASLSTAIAGSRLDQHRASVAGLLDSWIVDGSIIEDYSVIDLNGNRLAKVNRMVLTALADNTRQGLDPLFGIDRFIQATLEFYGLSLASLPPLRVYETELRPPVDQ